MNISIDEHKETTQIECKGSTIIKYNNIEVMEIANDGTFIHLPFSHKEAIFLRSKGVRVGLFGNPSRPIDEDSQYMVISDYPWGLVKEIKWK